ncbi:MAG: S46 family peptidase [Ignavibacteriales bacterium]|nr:S46 family peptidase [Ignavibacteriales bacterium]
MNYRFPKFLIGLLLPLLLLGSCSTQQQAARDHTVSSLFNVDTVKAGEFDTGKMWTFDYPPTDYFNRTYGFAPGADWYEKARLSALRLPGCSASFVSEDGLVFTNHHCARSALDAVNREGENITEDGFWAATLADERKVPRMYADQLMLMEDVTEEVVAAFESGKTEEERVTNRTAAMGEIEKRYRATTGLNCNVVTFYNGGKYSVYGYKRYTDVRLVFAPELTLGFFGGDYDNFTYPRYDLDVAFFRVYDEDGKPLKTSNYFKWSAGGAAEGEPVFVIGNPGRTSRLYSIAQLEFNRDHAYPYVLSRLSDMVAVYSTMLAKYPTQTAQYQTPLFSFSNSQKVYVGRIQGLHDPVIMAKKRDFERRFRNAVANNSVLKQKYENVWNDLSSVVREKSALFGEFQAYQFLGLGRPAVLTLASNVIDFAHAASMPDAERPARMKGTMLDSVRNKLAATTINQELDRELLANHLNFMKSVFAEKNAAFNGLLDGESAEEAATALQGKTILTDPEKLGELLSGGPETIFSSKDPFITFVLKTETRAREVRTWYADALSREQARVQVLGKALFDVYGTSIPPDATFTLRIADGVVRNYEYNGTVAPVYTTFYGLYDRYYSHQRREPWSLPDRWKNPPASFDLSARYNFVSTNDIIGGNSGSPVLNRNLEVVGIAFDGNIESLPGDFIFDDTKNRCVSVHSAGILEALEDIYKAERIVKELRAGKIR